MAKGNRKPVIMDRLLLALRIGNAEARYIAVCALAFLLLLGWLASSFQNSPAGLTSYDTLFFICASAVAIVLLFASGWLGFTAAGRRYSEQLFSTAPKKLRTLRALKVAFATGASAFAAFIVLFIAVLVVGGTDSVVKFFDGRILAMTYGTLLLVCLPFVLKYLK